MVLESVEQGEQVENWAIEARLLEDRLTGDIGGGDGGQGAQQAQEAVFAEQRHVLGAGLDDAALDFGLAFAGEQGAAEDDGGGAAGDVAVQAPALALHAARGEAQREGLQGADDAIALPACLHVRLSLFLGRRLG